MRKLLRRCKLSGNSYEATASCLGDELSMFHRSSLGRKLGRQGNKDTEEISITDADFNLYAYHRQISGFSFEVLGYINPVKTELN